MEQDVEYITEEKENGKKNYKIKGIFMQAGIKNKNGRVYPEEILQKEVARYNKEFINENRAYGELGHPEGPTINLERASHMITALYPDGKLFICVGNILSTPIPSFELIYNISSLLHPSNSIIWISADCISAFFISILFITGIISKSESTARYVFETVCASTP